MLCNSVGCKSRTVLKLAGREEHLLPCEQWFLQEGRYASMGKKPLRATVCFSIEHARPRDYYEYPTRRRQRELQQNNSLISKTTTLHVHHAFIFAFLCHLGSLRYGDYGLRLRFNMLLRMIKTT